MKIFNNKVYNLVRTLIYLALAVLTLIFVEYIVEHLKYFIGGLMVFYALEGILFEFFNNSKHYNLHSLYWNAVEFVIGTTLVLLVKNDSSTVLYAIVCVCWATWSILRETRELLEATEEFKEKISPIPSVLESLTVIIFSVSMIIEPGEHHAKIHLYLLAVELATKVLFPVIDNAWELHKQAKQSPKEA